MKLSRFEEMAVVHAPWFFSLVLALYGLLIGLSKRAGAELQFIVLLCSALICMSMYCVCYLLAKGLSGGEVRRGELPQSQSLPTALE